MCLAQGSKHVYHYATDPKLGSQGTHAPTARKKGYKSTAIGKKCLAVPLQNIPSVNMKTFSLIWEALVAPLEC